MSLRPAAYSRFRGHGTHWEAATRFATRARSAAIIDLSLGRTSNAAMNPLWPELDYQAWQDTRATLHLWTQIVGKIRLMQTPWLNHSWHVPLYVNSKGLTTSPIAHGSRSFEIQFDFLEHVLDITVSDGSARRLVLRPQSVANFYVAVMAALAELGIAVAINERPCEIADATAFSQDLLHTAYDPEYA